MSRSHSCAGSLFLFVLLLTLIFTAFASAQVSLVQLSQDTFTNSSSQHQSEVEPGAFSYGSTIVTAFQVARIYDGGGADIGFAASTDGGLTWTNGFLPGLTVYDGNGQSSAASDAAVAYDALHSVWLISVLPIGNNTSVAVSRSFDGINWSNPISVTNQGSPDKNWIACDNTPTSRFYGHCYSEWDDTDQGDLIEMSTSTDGGLTWSPEKTTAGGDYGIGGVPVVKPNGVVIVPINGFNGDIIAFTSTNGGKTWSRAVEAASDIEAFEGGSLRSAGLVSSAIDGKGKVYVAWPDCRFRANCSSNDIVYTTSSNGKKWTAVQRVPIDDVTSTVDHFITGLAIDPATSAKKAHLALAYYYYPVANCSANCQLYAGFIQSSTAGKTWSAPVTLAGPMKLTWLPQTFSGYMVADYISVGFANGKAFPIVAVAQANSGSTLHEAIYTTATGQEPSREEEEFLTAEGNTPVPNAHSTRGPREFLDQDDRIPVSGPRPPEKD